MLRDKTAFVRKIMDYFAEQGVKCSVADENLSLLITLSAGGRTHKFRCGEIAFSELRHCNKFYAAFERELSKLRTAVPPGAASVKRRPERRNFPAYAGK